MIFNKKIIGIILIVLFLSCVRYSFKGALPTYLKTIYIEDFDNNTQYAQVGPDFMDKVTAAFVQDNSLKVVDTPDGADLILSGKIASITKKTVSFTQTEQVNEYHMVVTIQAECLNTHTQKPLWKGSISRYGTISGTALTEEIDQAIETAIDQLVEDVVIKTIAAW